MSVENVLNIKGFDLKRTLEMDPEFLNTDGEHVHDQTVTSLSIVQREGVHMALVNKWIGELLSTKGNDIYRMKGVLSISGSKEKFVFQGVHMIFDGEFEGEWAEDETRESKLVFIGKDLDHKAIKAGFAACLDSPENAERIKAMEAAAASQRRAHKVIEAARDGDTEVLKQLTTEGADPSFANRAGQTALHIACLWGTSPCVDVLVKAGAKVNVKNDISGETPLHMLAISYLNEKGTMAGRLAAAKILVEAGADFTVTNDEGLMPHELLDAEDTGAKELRTALTADPEQPPRKAARTS